MKRGNKSIYSILGILSSGPKSGYDIKKMIERSTGHFWAESYGQIYPTLKMLVEEGYISITPEGNNSKPGRKLYVITECGRQELINWLNLPAESIQSGRNELLLKLFFGDMVPKEMIIRHIFEYKNRLQQELDIYNGIEKMLAENTGTCSNTVYQNLTLKHGQSVCRSLIEWCSRSIEIVNESAKDSK